MANKTVKTLIKRRPAADTAEPEQNPTFTELLDSLRDAFCNLSLHVGLASHELEELRLRFSTVADQLAEFTPEDEAEDAGEV